MAPKQGAEACRKFHKYRGLPVGLSGSFLICCFTQKQLHAIMFSVSRAHQEGREKMVFPPLRISFASQLSTALPLIALASPRVDVFPSLKTSLVEVVTASPLPYPAPCRLIVHNTLSYKHGLIMSVSPGDRSHISSIARSPEPMQCLPHRRCSASTE